MTPEASETADPPRTATSSVLRCTRRTVRRTDPQPSPRCRRRESGTERRNRAPRSQNTLWDPWPPRRNFGSDSRTRKDKCTDRKKMRLAGLRSAGGCEDHATIRGDVAERGAGGTSEEEARGKGGERGRGRGRAIAETSRAAERQKIRPAWVRFEARSSRSGSACEATMEKPRGDDGKEGGNAER